jgi:hypothetical protein
MYNSHPGMPLEILNQLMGGKRGGLRARVAVYGGSIERN